MLGPLDLEALLLARADAARGWTVPEIAARLVVSEGWAIDALESLCLGALLVEDGAAHERRYFYRPTTPALDEAVAALAEIYAERPADVMQRLNDLALQRVRKAAYQAFPVAFLLRTDDDRQDPGPTTASSDDPAGARRR